MIHDILDLHTHTIMSGHAYNTMQEMIRSASEKGVRLLGSMPPAFPAPAIRFISSISGSFPGNSSE